VIAELLADLNEQLRLTEELSSIDDHKYYYHTHIGYFGLMDAVADVIYGSVFSNKERFIRLMTEYCNWDFASHVSIPHLHQLLRLYPFPEFSFVRCEVQNILNTTNSEGTFADLSCDVPVGKVGSWFNHKGSRSLDLLAKTGLRLEDLTHAALLYRFRNRLVHSMRGFGYVPEPGNQDKEPYYCVFSQYQTESDDSNAEELIGRIYQLIYPAPFIAKLTSDCINKLPQHMKDFEMSYQRPKMYDIFFYEQLNTGNNSIFDQ